MAYLGTPESPNGVVLCVTDPDWFAQLKGVIAGEKLRVVLEIDVTDSKSSVRAKPLPGVSYPENAAPEQDSPVDAGGKEKKGGKAKEWRIEGEILSLEERSTTEADADAQDEGASEVAADAESEPE